MLLSGCSGANWDDAARGFQSGTSHYQTDPTPRRNTGCTSSSQCMHLQNGVCLIPSGQYEGTCTSVAQ